MRLRIVKPTGIVLFLFLLSHIVFAGTPTLHKIHLSTGESITVQTCLSCDNVTNGGAIGGDEFGCPNPVYDPGLIYNLLLPSGGTGAIEYVWMFTNENPYFGNANWSPLPNSNSPDYNPGPITITTYFMRCSRRAGCSLYTGETNFVKKGIECCPGNVTDGGLIGDNQNSCTIPFDPAVINNVTLPSGGSGTIEYQWLVSTVGGSINNGTWSIISGATSASYDPPIIYKTSFYIRRAKVKFCTEYEYSNVVKITLTNGVKFTISKTDPTCFEANNGSVTIKISQGTPTFMIKWSNSVIMTPKLINLGGGMYMVTVTDANSCSATGIITLDEPGEIDVSGITSPETCSTLGKISLTASGGFAPYAFKWNTGDTTNLLSDKASGKYSVTVTDKNGCTKAKSFTIADQTNIVINEKLVPNICFGGKDGSIKLTVSGGASPYNYQWSNNINNHTPNNTGLSGGNYTVTVTDNTGCSRLKYFTILENSEIQISGNTSDAHCFGEKGGSIITSTSGGISPYTYLWSYNGAVSKDLSNIAAGNYTVTVTDAVGCSVKKSFSIAQPNEIKITAKIAKPICVNDTTGSIDISVSGGFAPYSFKWNGVISTEDIYNKKAGMYKVEVTDSTGCSVEAVFIIQNPQDIKITSAIISPYCLKSNGSISITVSGGNPEYSYLWSNGAITKDIADISAGLYTVTVTDDKGCTKIASFAVSDDSGILILESITNVKCFGDSNGVIQISLTGGVDPYTINWNTGATNTQLINDLAAGNYSVTVTDINLCKGVKQFKVLQPAEINITTNLINPLCNGSQNGSIVVNASGGIGPYTYKWSNGSSNSSLNNIAAGIYFLTVTDSKDCSAEFSISLADPEKIQLSGFITNPLCYQSNEGTIDLTVSGGTLPYSYVWNGIASSEDQKDLSAGIYLVEVTDKNGCVQQKSFEIVNPNELELDGKITNAYCDKNTGAIELIVSGGIGIYSYLWSDGSTDKDLVNQYPGKYTVVVADENGCSKSADFTIIDEGGLKITELIVDNKCHDAAAGSIEIAVNIGVAPFSIEWSNGTIDTTKIDGLLNGNYSVTVTDKNLCSASKSFVINAPPALAITGISTNVVCNATKTGSINLTVSGGSPGYSYLWNNGVQTQNIAGVGAGNYTVTVTDQNGCTDQASFTITETQAIVINEIIIDLICNGSNEGSILLNVTGGTPNYTYHWNDGSSSDKLSNLAAGSYTVTVTDANLCSAVKSYELTEAAEILVNGSLINPSCNGGQNGSITINVSGGFLPYKFIWSNGAKSQNLANITAGNYTLTITDNKGCSKVESYSLSEGGGMQLLESIDNITCHGSKNGKISLTSIGGVPPYTYVWNPANYTGSSISNLGPGTYSVTVNDQTGCKTVKSFTLTEPDQLTVTISKQDISCFGNQNGKLTAIPSGGTPVYSFKWNTGADTSSIEGLIAGTYIVSVTDINSCKATTSATVINPSELKLTAKAGKTSCYNSTDAAIDLTVSGGTAPYSYLWNNNATTQDLTGLGVGNYTVTVTDSHGCTKTGTYAIASPLPINFDVIATDQSCINQNDGKAYVTNITGGTPNFSFKWNDPKNSTTQSIFNLAPGFYQVTVKDSKNCSAIKSLEIKSSTLKCTSNIGDYVWLDVNINGLQDSIEEGVNGIVVHLVNLGNDGVFGTGDDILVDTKTTKTDNGKKGYYLFKDVAKGTYVIKYFIDTDKYAFTFKDKGNNDAKDSDVNPANSLTDPFSVKPGDADNLSYDAGIYQYCDNITHGGLICCDEVLCSLGQVPSLISNVQNASGGTGPIEYLWLYSTTNPVYSPGNPGWIMIPNSNTPSYQPGPLYVTTYFVRCSKRGDCTNFAGETNVVTKKVVDGKPAQINGAPPVICKNESVNFMSTDYGPGVTYLWDLGPGGIPGVATTNDVLTKWSFPGVKTISLYVSYEGCTSKDVAVVVVSGCTAKVEVIDFTAIMNKEHQVDLAWKVDNANNHIFEIERSQDNKSFTAITAVDGYPDQTGAYKIKDLKPEIGINYYRIKVYDVDASYKYTDVRDVMLEDYQNQNLAVYPNPATNILTIEPIKATKRPGKLDISDAFGRIIYQKDLEAEFKQFDIDISKYVSGTYFVKIKIDGKREITYRIFKIE